MAERHSVHEEPRKRFGLGKIAGIAAGVVATFYLGFTTVVQPHEYGIRQVSIPIPYLRGEKGIQKEVHGKGLHVVLPFLETMHRLPKDLQVLHLNRKYREMQQLEPYSRAEKAAHIQTSDGFYVDVDISIMYRVCDPYKVITTLGPGRLFEDNGIIPKAEPALKETFGKLEPEDFYNPLKREQRQREAESVLDARLRKKGLCVEHILVRFPNYHPAIQAKLEQRKLEDQLVFKNQALTAQQEAAADLAKVRKEGDAAFKVKLQGGKAYMTRKNAEKNAYVRTTTANANLLVELAKADRTKNVNEAYQGEGAEKLLGLEMAKVLQGVDTILMPVTKEGLGNLDLDAIIKSWGIKPTKGSPEGGRR